MVTPESEKLRAEREAINLEAQVLKEKARALTAQINAIELAVLAAQHRRLPGTVETVAVDASHLAVKGN